MVFARAAGEDTQQHHGNSLASRRDWQELESGRSMEEHTLAAAAPPAPAAIRAWGMPPCMSARGHVPFMYMLLCDCCL